MPPWVCRGCANRLPTSTAGVEIFSRDTSLRKEQNDVKTGIELITGVAVSDTDGLPGRLCVECKNKLEEFLAFRTQLLTSLKVFRSAGYDSSKSDQPLRAIISSPSLSNTTRIKSNDILAPELEIKKEDKISVGYSQTDSSNGLNGVNLIDEDESESDIDVCSGEDDGVLELDVQSKKDEIYEIESSGESDIQVCDY